MRVDPTAAIAPDRIEFGLREAMAEEGSFLENNLTSPHRYGDFAALQWASLQFDRINYHWQRWVVGYQGQSQMNLMSRLPGGIGMKELGYITAGLVGVALLIAGLVSALSMGREFGKMASVVWWVPGTACVNRQACPCAVEKPPGFWLSEWLRPGHRWQNLRGFLPAR